MRARDGGAILAVMALLVLVFPLVTSLFLRSHAALAWVARLHFQQQATALAEGGEATALRVLAAGGGAGEGDRLIAEGGMQYRILSLGPTPVGQVLYLVAGEGLYQNEERMVVSVVEVSVVAGVRLLIPRDRSWLLPGASGGTQLSPAELAAAHRAKVDQYLARLAQESGTDAVQFVRTMNDESMMLDCPEIRSKWSELATALAAAKAPPPP